MNQILWFGLNEQGDFVHLIRHDHLFKTFAKARFTLSIGNFLMIQLAHYDCSVNRTLFANFIIAAIFLCSTQHVVISKRFSTTARPTKLCPPLIPVGSILNCSSKFATLWENKPVTLRRNKTICFSKFSTITRFFYENILYKNIHDEIGQNI